MMMQYCANDIVYQINAISRQSKTFMTYITTEPWYSYIQPTQQRLIELSYHLYDRESNAPGAFDDYAFVVFPMAKAYEGFLKQYFYDSKLITEEVFKSKKFRIGRALNPDVHFNQRDEDWLYDNVERTCGKAVAQQLWQTWLTCRNRIFHFFPEETQPVTLATAAKDLELLSQAMEAAVQCQIEMNRV